MNSLQHVTRLNFTILSLVGITLILSLFSGGCSESPSNELEKSTTAVTTATVNIPVEGMTCESCENFLRGRLTAMAGIVDATASHVEKRIEVTYHPAEIDVEKMVAAINSTNYKATMPVPAE